jgi:UDP-N-acetylmuramoylalanine--D-glutamate ligase
VLFPDSGNKIKLPGVKILKTKSMQKAVEFAYKYTTPRSICLLSCASPSYSLWKNFEEKGDQFQTMVKKLAKIK